MTINCHGELVDGDKIVSNGQLFIVRVNEEYGYEPVAFPYDERIDLVSDMAGEFVISDLSKPSDANLFDEFKALFEL